MTERYRFLQKEHAEAKRARDAERRARHEFPGSGRQRKFERTRDYSIRMQRGGNPPR